MQSYTQNLAAQWRTVAETFSTYGDNAHATTLRQCAADLEAAEREHDLAALTLDEAADESGHSYSSIQKKVATGELQNIGERHRPRVRRCDLPRKKGKGSLPTPVDEILNARMAG